LDWKLNGPCTKILRICCSNLNEERMMEGVIAALRAQRDIIMRRKHDATRAESMKSNLLAPFPWVAFPESATTLRHEYVMVRRLCPVVPSTSASTQSPPSRPLVQPMWKTSCLKSLGGARCSNINLQLFRQWWQIRLAETRSYTSHTIVHPSKELAQYWWCLESYPVVPCC